MKFVTIAAALAMTLASCGNTAKQNASSSVKSEVAAKANYSCLIWSELDLNASPSVKDFKEQFDFKSTDTSITKIVGVTPGDQYVGEIFRPGGSKIIIQVTNTITKSRATTQVGEGEKSITLAMSPDDKFSVGIWCDKRP